jgi:hypothetical protein
MWRSLVAWVLVVGLAWSAWSGAGHLYAWEYSVGHFAFARVGAPALHFALGGLVVALDVVAVLALLLPRPRGFGVVLGALVFGLAHDLAVLRLVSADLDGARRVYAQGRAEQGSIASEAALDALFSPAGQHQVATIAFVLALTGMALLMVIRPYFEPR